MQQQLLRQESSSFHCSLVVKFSPAYYLYLTTGRAGLSLAPISRLIPAVLHRSGKREGFGIINCARFQPRFAWPMQFIHAPTDARNYTGQATQEFLRREPRNLTYARIIHCCIHAAIRIPFRRCRASWLSVLPRSAGVPRPLHLLYIQPRRMNMCIPNNFA